MMDVDETVAGGSTDERVWSVSEVNRLVRDVLEQNVRPFWVKGEIGNITIHRSGHVYFSLKDARSQVPAVFFRGAEMARRLQLETGTEVEVWGRLTVYEPRGAYQVLVERIRPCGVGDLQRRFDELKARLRAEGLFDEDRKRPIPMLPKCVGVVTSPQGAAIRDFLHVLGRRFANVHVRVTPVPVQGPKAAGQVAGAIGYLNRSRACDVIVVTRGGGSLEDLWAFNEEVVARAVAESAIPVISAVGHERDFTICDFVSDLRVATPSVAGELVVGPKAELVERIANHRDRIASLLRLNLADLRQRVERAAGSPVFREPANLVRVYQQRVDELGGRIETAVARRLEGLQARVERATASVRALGPENVLQRGYAIVLDPESGQAVSNAEEVAAGQLLTAVLAKGRLDVRVESMKEL
ncbi:MAG: exodeoxyribonuclease VII large subunit [Lentisphaeria bacterium]|nr:exodeoxyribonuclease VII large subunit [Lentisphaeria bacterium]